MSKEDLEKFEKELFEDLKDRITSDEIITVTVTGNTSGGEKMGKIGEVREANATKVIEFMKTLGVEEKEFTKILSRAYRLAAKKE